MEIAPLQFTVLSGYRTYYYQHAIVYMEEATELRVTNKRRLRWMTGVVDSDRLYMPRIDQKLQKGSTRQQRMQRYHATNLNIVYGLVGAALGYAAISLVLALVLLVCASPLWWQALLGSVIGIGAIYVYFLIPTVFAVLSDWKVIGLPFFYKIGLIFAHPVYYMGYIPIMRRALFSKKGRNTWEAIDRADFTRKEGECP